MKNEKKKKEQCILELAGLSFSTLLTESIISSPYYPSSFIISLGVSSCVAEAILWNKASFLLIKRTVLGGSVYMHSRNSVLKNIIK